MFLLGECRVGGGGWSGGSREHGSPGLLQLVQMWFLLSRTCSKYREA